MLPVDLDAVRAVLERAVARACPRRLAHLREDIVQASLLRLVEMSRRDEQFAPRSSSYLWEVAFSVTIDELRRVERRRESGADTESLTAVPDGSAAGPEERAAARELGEAIRSCLVRLVAPRRWAVGLYLHGFPAVQAAGVLGWDVKRIQNLTYRGLADLRDCLRGKGFEP